MRFLLVALLFSLTLQALPQSVTISGSAPGAEGKSVHLFITKDFITNLEYEAAKAKIDSVGHFTLKTDISRVAFASLSIDLHRMEMFLEPGKSYSLEIAPLAYNSSVEINPFIQSENLKAEFRNEDPDELNFTIQQFNILHSNFLLKHFNDLYRDREVALLDTFKFEIVKSFLTTQNPYFGIYTRYKMAGLIQIAKAMPPAKFEKQFFTDSPIYYDNVAYMELFNQYYTKYMTATSRSLKFIDYASILKGPNPYDAMMKALTADTMLKKPQFRELVMLKGLMEMYNMPGYDQKQVLTLIRIVADQGKFPDNKLIAEDIVKSLTHLKPGSPAPEFTLQDRNKKQVSLASLKGKPVVLGFWTTYCQGCLSEMESMKPLFDKYGSKVHFVSICADREFMKMLFFIDLKKNFKWTFLHIGDQLELLKDYDVRSYPLFILIDGNGDIVSYPAPFPGKGLDASLEKLVSP